MPRGSGKPNARASAPYARTRDVSHALITSSPPTSSRGTSSSTSSRVAVRPRPRRFSAMTRRSACTASGSARARRNARAASSVVRPRRRARTPPCPKMRLRRSTARLRDVRRRIEQLADLGAVRQRQIDDRDLALELGGQRRAPSRAARRSRDARRAPTSRSVRGTRGSPSQRLHVDQHVDLLRSAALGASRAPRGSATPHAARPVDAPASASARARDELARARLLAR